MNALPRAIRRALLPAAVFAAVGALHFTWLGLFPEHDPAQDRWAAVAAPSTTSWVARYLERQDYWLGFSYALPLAFAVAAFRRYREERLCSARTLAVGGLTLSGVLCVVGCFLIGCCGSPMLGVYLGLFGAAFLPFARPLVAGLTTASLLVAWWWMERRRRRIPAAASLPSACLPQHDCECRTAEREVEVAKGAAGQMRRS